MTGTNSKMIDMIIVVRDNIRWHELNMSSKFNISHYSGAGRVFRPIGIDEVQRFFGAKVYFNPFVEIDGLILQTFSFTYWAIFQ